MDAGSFPTTFCANYGTGEPCASMPTASSAPSVPRPSVMSDRPAHVFHDGHVDDVDAPLPGHREALRHAVDGDDVIAAVPRDPGGHLPDGSEAEDRETATLGHAGVLHALPRGGQHVGEVEEALVGRALGDDDRTEVGVRDPQVLRLAAGDLAVELGEAEQRRPHPLVAVLRGLALREQVALAHPAMSTADGERDHHAVADLEVADGRAHLLDDPHRLVPEDVAHAHEGAEHLVEVQVGAADRGARDPDDGVGRGLDPRVRHFPDLHVALPLPGQCLHLASSCRSEVVGREGGGYPIGIARHTVPPPRHRRSGRRGSTRRAFAARSSVVSRPVGPAT